ncbi:hypothetical protein B0J14DRAFT_679502 [Halenospora varia]|nr:hypothetical protein B0J14DRAFT_679502 [Halenospora varia]
MPRATKTKARKALGELSGLDLNSPKATSTQSKKRARTISAKQPPAKRLQRGHLGRKCKALPDPPTTFHDFKKLPPDVQLRIWEFVPDIGRHIYIRSFADGADKEPPIERVNDGTFGRTHASCSPNVKIRLEIYAPTLPKVFQLDRATYVLTRRWLWCTAHLEALKPSQNSILINFKKDTIHFEDTRAFKMLFMPEIKPCYRTEERCFDAIYADFICPIYDTAPCAEILRQNTRHVIIQDGDDFARYTFEWKPILDFQRLQSVGLEYAENQIAVQATRDWSEPNEWEVRRALEDKDGRIELFVHREGIDNAKAIWIDNDLRGFKQLADSDRRPFHFY